MAPEDRLAISPRLHDAVIFDLDGVVTRTARVHAAAWKRLFDDFLAKHAERRNEAFIPFDADTDYRQYVDGKPRYDGVSSFLASRNITLPFGRSDDDPSAETICGLGNRKNRYFLERLHSDGVEVYDTTVDFIKALRQAGMKTAIISASRNCAGVLRAARIEHLFDTRVDGVDADRLALAGKPAPDVFLEAAQRLDVAVDRAVVVEDAIAGVRAGHAGGVALVIGVDRTGHRSDLEHAGADAVVASLAEVRVASADVEGPTRR